MVILFLPTSDYRSGEPQPFGLAEVCAILYSPKAISFPYYGQRWRTAGPSNPLSS